ncbi:MAG TPA: glycine--tRNA ligase subunit beta [Deltaproteobacteria bacterium]|nr:glycine--tRNA ligase subunit beta [Deltaproteobacteria bacterium]
MGSSLLFEIGTEEIPSGFNGPALDFIRSWVSDKFSEIKLDYESLKVFGTPRRLALLATEIGDKLPDMVEKKMGPPKRAAFDEKGNPTKAGLGFANNAGVDISEISFEQTPKGEYLCVTRTIPGKATVEVLPEILEEVIARIPFPKTMKWSNPDVRFARPVHWILALFGDMVLPVKFGNITSGRVTYGNRFMTDGALEVTTPDKYEELLEAGYVIPGVEKRKNLIWNSIEAHAKEINAQVIDRDLLDEVVNLVEYPHVIVGSFDESFLDLPAEVLVTVMKHHQRFFPLYTLDTQPGLRPYFCAVSNIVPKDDALVRRGNERVLKARLDDGKYFFTEDMKVPIEEYAQRLKDVIFHKDLGTSFEKVERFTNTALYLADILAPDKKDKVREAAYLSKADLNSLMVCELPELQGIMGREYALHQGRDPEVSRAIHEHYLPTSAEDELPSDIIGDLVGIADRIDTICGCFGIGLIPSGTSDPYALRRQTIAIENILLTKGYRISISALAEQALYQLKTKLKRDASEVKQDLVAFFKSRFVAILQARGVSGDIIDAVLRDFDDPLDAFTRAQAIAGVKHQPWFESICSASKRVENILKKVESAPGLSEALFVQDEEKALYRSFKNVEASFISLADSGEYTSALKLLAGLKDPIDDFFDKVLVMAEDVDIRNNRIALLKSLVSLFDQIAQFSRISVS